MTERRGEIDVRVLQSECSEVAVKGAMGRDQELIEAARTGNYPQCEKVLSGKPKRAGPFAR